MLVVAFVAFFDSCLRMGRVDNSLCVHLVSECVAYI